MPLAELFNAACSTLLHSLSSSSCRTKEGTMTTRMPAATAPCTPPAAVTALSVECSVETG
jgi:hypothetical protein